MSPSATTHPIHFEDRSGVEFERLCFAYILRAQAWKRIDWYGQLGGDKGRDIFGIDGDGRSVCYQCANYQKLPFRKAKLDIGKIARGPEGVPDAFIVIVGGKVSADLKKKIEAHATSVGISNTETWSGVELEERLRRDTPELLQRFNEGIPFPETVDGLRVFGIQAGELRDADILKAIAPIFDRPAFTTPFRSESSLPDFKQAITDTIEALNTGVRRLRDGTEIERIPPRHRITNEAKKAGLARVVERLVDLRAAFEGLLRTREIRTCGCGKADCDTYMISERATDELTRLRDITLDEFRGLQ